MWPAEYSLLGVLVWRPRVSALGSAALISLLVWCLWSAHRRMAARMTHRRAAWLLAPRVALLALLAVALFDPYWARETAVRGACRVVALVDVSSSMDVADRAGSARVERARRLVDRLRERLPAHAELTVMEFDETVREPARRASAGGPQRGTDIGGCLASLTGLRDLPAHKAVVLLSDGGDEAAGGAALPQVPLFAVGVGTDLSGVNDVRVGDLQAPASVEKDAPFEIAADLAAGGPDTAFGARLARLQVAVERLTPEGQWSQAEAKTVNLENRRARVRFELTEKEAGAHRYRVAVAPVDGEASPLNNRREFSVDVQRKALHVLYFTRELNAGLKMLRNELTRDPGVKFTALFRTLGERFTVQGERLPGDESLDAGFPTDASVLKLFDCVVLDSFPAGEWRQEQMAALVSYVQGGGAVVLLAGEGSYGGGEYAATPLAALFPCQAGAGGAGAQLGQYPVSVPAAAADHPVVAGVSELLARAGPAAFVESVHRSGTLKAGAAALMTASGAGWSAPLVAVHRYGDGMAMAIESNTLWKWARRGDALAEAYGRLWRQAVRNLTRGDEGGQLLAVRWDQRAYRPGDRAVVEIVAAGKQAGAGLDVTASLECGAQVRSVAVDPMQGRAGAFVARVPFDGRGRYAFQLTARRGGQVLEAYERALEVGPTVGEGARLELNESALRDLVRRSNGGYAAEEGADALWDDVAARLNGEKVVTEVPVVSGSPWFAVAVMVLLAAEWSLRRAVNLV